MYGFPVDLDLSPIVGEFTTQLCVGQFDVAFSLGSIRFLVQSPITLTRQGQVVGRWDPANWPPAEFYHLMNTPVAEVKATGTKTLVIRFENGLEAHLADESDQYESMQIIVGPSPGKVYIV